MFVRPSTVDDPPLGLYIQLFNGPESIEIYSDGDPLPPENFVGKRVWVYEDAWKPHTVAQAKALSAWIEPKRTYRDGYVAM